MKKLFAMALAVMMVVSMATVASAESTTTLTTTVPAATYTLNIPANQEIAYGATSTDIGSLTVTDASGFAVGKNLAVTITFDDFKCESTTTTIPFSILMDTPQTNSDDYIAVTSGTTVTFKGTSTGATEEYVQVKAINTYYDLEDFLLKIDSADWGKALAGEYTATITFTCEVVAE